MFKIRSTFSPRIMRNASIEQQLAAAERSFGSLSSKGCEARPYYDDIPMCRGREGGDFGTWRC